MSYGVYDIYLRHKNGSSPRRSPENPPKNIEASKSADYLGAHLFKLIGGRSGGTVSFETAKSNLKNSGTMHQFGVSASDPNNPSELAKLLTSSNGRINESTMRKYALIKWLFSVIDQDQDQHISAWELETALYKSSTVRQEIECTPEQAAPLFRQMDVKRRGRITLIEFYRYLSQARYAPAKGAVTNTNGPIKRLFDRIDTNRSGGITLSELETALKNDRELCTILGWPWHAAATLFTFLDRDNSGVVTQDELYTYMRVQILFNLIDTNHSGFIDPYEFGDALGNPKLSQELGVEQRAAQKIFRAIDVNGQQSISFAEFFGYFSTRLGPDLGLIYQQKAFANRNANPSDKYEKIKKLGEGAFGVVFLIKRRADGLQLIEKRPKLDSGCSMEDVKTEADMLARIKHSHIIRFIESYWEKKALIIVTEYAAGGDLRAKIRRNGCDSVRTMEWFTQICDAVKYLHDRYILHRDLKPDNIFLTGGGSVKIGDLGLATQLRGERDMAMSMCGTPNYMAPELLNGLPYNFPNDVWAMGCILYEMATGKIAFRTQGAIVRLEIPRDTPQYCRRLVDGILVSAPQRRLTVDRILDDLEYEFDPTGMASYMSDRFRKGRRVGARTVSPLDV
eukprot:TRINITY_DN760_c1_g1_i1.p1 TRINITY_DN760_c1_g1~~TRINITY_DN760_c1_g1_i1.p1  ORF type:complete len:708 (+),score=133.26 TRINITY_DN760_c1_g1_i1:259-2124(+)